MKYPKLYSNDLVTIDEVAYVVTRGLSEPTKNNRVVYNVELRSVKYNPEKYPEYIRCKNTELPVYKKIKF